MKKLIVILAVPITVVLLVLCATAPALAQPQLENTYDLYDQSNRSWSVITTMTIFNQKGSFFLIQGDRWGGSGNVSGSSGYYDWKFLDGKSGRTTFTVQDNGNLHGQVRGPGKGLNWDYIAIPRTRPKPKVEPKSCKACFEDEEKDNNGCAGTSSQKLKCIYENKLVREKCQETCILP